MNPTVNIFKALGEEISIMETLVPMNSQSELYQAVEILQEPAIEQVEQPQPRKQLGPQIHIFDDNNPCKHCGCAAVTFQTEKTFEEGTLYVSAMCHNCGISQYYNSSEKNIVKNWNILNNIDLLLEFHTAALKRTQELLRKLRSWKNR